MEIFKKALNDVKKIFTDFMKHMENFSIKEFYKRIKNFSIESFKYIRKNNLSKRTVMLIISVILVVSVCFSAVYAWFFDKSSARANISGEVLNFDFRINGSYKGEMLITAGDAISADKFIYTVEPKTGMFPGQKIEANIILSNLYSDLSADYKIIVKSCHVPEDCIMYLRDSSGKGYGRWTFKPGDEVYPTSKLSAGSKNVLTLTLEWPRDYKKYIEGSTIYTPYKSTDEKNAADMAFLESCRGNNGAIIKNFSVVLEVQAEQVE